MNPNFYGLKCTTTPHLLLLLVVKLQRALNGRMRTSTRTAHGRSTVNSTRYRRRVLTVSSLFIFFFLSRRKLCGHYCTVLFGHPISGAQKLEAEDIADIGVAFSDSLS